LLRSAYETRLSAIIVQQGKLLDFIDSVTQREETPEEYVRQEIAKSLVRETYGIVGGVVLATAFYDQKVLANHVIRIAARKDATARPGYILTALTHPALGRPLVKSLTFGSSVPEISPDDIESFGVVRLAERDENRIADLAEKSAELRAKADILENQLAAEAEAILDRFIVGKR
jgi:hypothetical protein